MHKSMMDISHMTSFGDVIHMDVVGFFLVCIWRPGFRTIESRTCVAVSCGPLPLRMHGIAGTVSFFKFQASLRHHLEVIRVIGRNFVDFPVATC